MKPRPKPHPPSPNPAPTDPTREPALPATSSSSSSSSSSLDAAGSVELGGTRQRPRGAPRTGGVVHEPLELGEDHAHRRAIPARSRAAGSAPAHSSRTALGVPRGAGRAGLTPPEADHQPTLRRAAHAESSFIGRGGQLPREGSGEEPPRTKLARRRLRDGRRRPSARGAPSSSSSPAALRDVPPPFVSSDATLQDDPLAEGVAQLRASSADEVVQGGQNRAPSGSVAACSSAPTSSASARVRLQEGLADVRSPEVRLAALRLRLTRGSRTSRYAGVSHTKKASDAAAIAGSDARGGEPPDEASKTSRGSSSSRGASPPRTPPCPPRTRRSRRARGRHVDPGEGAERRRRQRRSPRYRRAPRAPNARRARMARAERRAEARVRNGSCLSWHLDHNLRGVERAPPLAPVFVLSNATPPARTATSATPAALHRDALTLSDAPLSRPSTSVLANSRACHPACPLERPSTKPSSRGRVVLGQRTSSSAGPIGRAAAARACEARGRPRAGRPLDPPRGERPSSTRFPRAPRGDEGDGRASPGG